MLRRVVLTRAIWRNIPEDAILRSHRRENLKSYIVIISIIHALYIHKLILLHPL
jgi:hypothetical protein